MLFFLIYSGLFEKKGIFLSVLLSLWKCSGKSLLTAVLLEKQRFPSSRVGRSFSMNLNKSFRLWWSLLLMCYWLGCELRWVIGDIISVCYWWVAIRDCNKIIDLLIFCSPNKINICKMLQFSLFISSLISYLISLQAYVESVNIFCLKLHAKQRSREEKSMEEIFMDSCNLILPNLYNIID